MSVPTAITLGAPDLTNYEYIGGSLTTHIVSGVCEFHMDSSAITSPTNLSCVLHSAGCGTGKGGGHIYGSCTAKIHYIPQSGDVIAIKEYCFATVIGIPAAKPGSYDKGCVMN